MPTFPFSGNPNQRGTGTTDRRMVNVVFDRIADEIVRDYELYVVTRPCLVNSTQPSGAAAGRGIFAWAKTGHVYSVFGTQLMGGAGGTTTLASLATSTGRVWFDTTPETASTQIAIMSDGTDSYHIDKGGATVLQIDENDDGDYPQSNLGPAVFFSNYIFYAKAGQAVNTNLNNFTAFTAGDAFSFGADGDALECIWKQKDQLIGFGKGSIEFTFDNGNPTGSPLLAIDQNRLKFGIATKNSLAWSGDALMFVGENAANGDGGRSVWLLQPGLIKEVSKTPLNRILAAEGSTISSCTAWMERVNGQLVYVLNLSVADRSFVYHLADDSWTEWEDANGGNKFNGAFATSLNGTIFVQDATNGRVYTFSSSAFQDSGTGITVTLQTGKQGTTVPVRQTDRQANLVADTQHVQYLSLPGVAGNFASTPDAASLDITGDIDIRALIAPNDWTPAAASDVIGKFVAAGDQRSYLLFIQTDGALRLTWSTTGANTVADASTVATGFTDGSAHWVRATLDVDDGGGNRVTKFYTSDDGVNWTQLGATVTTAATTSIFNSTATLEVGSQEGGTAQLLAGKVYRAQVYNGINGTLVADFNASFMAAGGTSYVDATGKTWTVNTSGGSPAAIVSEPDSAVSGKQVGLAATISTSDTDYGTFTDRGQFDMAKNEKRVQRLSTYKGGRAYKITYAGNRQFRAQALVTDTLPGVK